MSHPHSISRSLWLAVPSDRVRKILSLLISSMLGTRLRSFYSLWGRRPLSILELAFGTGRQKESRALQTSKSIPATNSLEGVLLPLVIASRIHLSILVMFHKEVSILTLRPDQITLIHSHRVKRCSAVFPELVSARDRANRVTTFVYTNSLSWVVRFGTRFTKRIVFWG